MRVQNPSPQATQLTVQPQIFRAWPSVCPLLAAGLALFFMSSSSHSQACPPGGEPLDPDQAENVRIVEDELLSMATAADGNFPHLSRLLQAKAACIRKLLAAGRICSAGVDVLTPHVLGHTDSDGLCTCDADRINILDTLLNADTQLRLAYLVQTVAHEVDHALQWGISRSIGEWEAHSIGQWILRYWLRVKNLSPEDKKALEFGVKTLVDVSRVEHCRAVTDPPTRRRRIDNAHSQTFPRGSPNNPAVIYVVNISKSGRVEITQTSTHQMVRSLDSGFGIITDMQILTVPAGTDALYLTGTDHRLEQGGLRRFIDLDADGLLDQSSLTDLDPRSVLVAPVSLLADSVGTTLYLLDVDEAGDLAIFTVRDTDADGTPDLLSEEAIARSVSFSELSRAWYVQSARPGFLRLSTQPRGVDVLGKGDSFLDVFDDDGDGHAERVSLVDYYSTLASAGLTIVGELHSSDSSLIVRAALNETFEIWITDASGENLLEPLGRGSGSEPDLLNEVQLGRSLREGEFLRAVASEEALPGAKPHTVLRPRPEIKGIDKATALPGEVVTLSGRNLAPDPIVTCSGIPSAILAAAPHSIRFIAPEVSPNPTGFCVVEVSTNQGSSGPAGILIHGDCNHNGIADMLDLSGGSSEDKNGNGIPDECERGTPTSSLVFGLSVLVILLLLGGIALYARRRRAEAE